MTATSKRVALWLYYGGLSVLLLLVLTTALPAMLPSVARQIGNNTEGYLFAIALAAWIQFGIPRTPVQSRMKWALIIAGAFLVIGVALVLSDLPSRFRTLNEACLGLAFLIPYVTLPRPVRRWALAVVVTLVALTIYAVIWAPESWIIDQAETFFFVILAILTFDVFDKPLLSPNAHVNPGARAAWYGFMILEPVIVSLLGTDIRTGGGGVAITLEYLGRLHESFFGVLLVALILHLVRDYRSHLE